MIESHVGFFQRYQRPWIMMSTTDVKLLGVLRYLFD